MIRAYLDGDLIYDSRSPSLGLTELKLTGKIDGIGSASIGMPPTHPRYGAGVWYKSILRVERDGARIFRGRYLAPEEDFRGNRVMKFESERGMLCDSIIRPQTFSGSPAQVFGSIISQHNTEVDATKRFTVGVVYLGSDAPSTITYALEQACTAEEALSGLCTSYGGHIKFTVNELGDELISLVTITASANPAHTVRVAENLMDVKKKGSGTFATRLVPYGKADDATGKRLTIKSVNSGVDSLENSVAMLFYGKITATVFYDDEDDPTRLKHLGEAYLASISEPLQTIEVSAVDCPAKTGDTVRVISPTNSMDTRMIVQETTFDALHPEKNRMVLGLSVRSMSAGFANDMRSIRASIRGNFRVINSRIGAIEGGARYLKANVDLNDALGVGKYRITSSIAYTLTNAPQIAGVTVAGAATMTVSNSGAATFGGQSCTAFSQAYLVESGSLYVRTVYASANGSAVYGYTAWAYVNKSAYSEVSLN